jgi:hypothetical protein
MLVPRPLEFAFMLLVLINMHYTWTWLTMVSSNKVGSPDQHLINILLNSPL